jgi:hypothetical protein
MEVIDVVSSTLTMVLMRTQGVNLTRSGELSALIQVDRLSMPACSTGTAVGTGGGNGGGTGWQGRHQGAGQAIASSGAAFLPTSVINPTFAKRRSDAYVGSQAWKPPV